MKKIFGILICMLVIISVVLTTTGQNVTTKITVPEITSATVDVSIHDYYFSPTPVTINVGDTIRWTNVGPSPHSSTSDTAVWDSGVLGVGQTYSYTFNTAGTYPYHCSLHTMMHGSVVVTGGNQPPNTPSTPSGPTSLTVGVSGAYSTSATDPDGNQVQYMFDWDAAGVHDYSAWSSLVSSGQSVSMSHSWNNAGTYLVKAQAKDSNGATSGWSNGLTVIVSGGNQPPNTPSTPSGPISLTVGVSGAYSTSATDPDGNQVQYMFDWDAAGVHDYSAWSSLVSSGQSVSMSHSWNNAGTYLVKTQAKDSNGATSGWSNGLTVIVSGGNQPPNTPNTPSGPISLTVGHSGTYSTSATDPDSDQIQYQFDWDSTGSHNYSSWTNLVNSGQSASMSQSWNTPGTYIVKAQARDLHGAVSGWSSGLTVTVTSGGNQPPNKPTINGIVTGKTGIAYAYTAVTTDPDGDNVSYLFDWGDGTNTGWTIYVPSGTLVHDNKTWSTKGTYTVEVKAKDTHGLESEWGTLTVTMPKTYIYNPIIQLIMKMLERFPFFEKILNLYHN